MDETLACPACRASLTDSNAGGAAAFVCTSCGLRFPIVDGISELLPPSSSISRDEQARIHDDLSVIHNARKLPIYWQTGFRYAFNLLVIKHSRMIAKLRPRKGEAYLDVGCQDGMMLSQIARRHGIRGTGVDVSRASLRLAANRNESGNRYYLADAQSLPFQDASFDCAHSVGTMEHVADRDLYLRELARVLKPGGRLLFDMLNRRDALTFHGFERWFAKRQGRDAEILAENLRIGHDPATFLLSDEVAGMAGHAGLRVRSVHHYNAFFPVFFDTRLPAVLARIRGQSVDFHGRPLGCDPGGAHPDGAHPGGAHPDDSKRPGATALFARRAATLGLKGFLPVAEFLDWPLTAMHYGNTFYVLAEKS